jgi:hypothetical protein
MTIDERIADLRAALRQEAVSDLLMFASQIRAATDRAAVLEEASGAFADIPAVLEFLKTLPPSTETMPNPDRGGDVHLGAQRFARVRVAEIQLYHAAQMKTGRGARDVYGALKSQMDAAREAYREKFLTPLNGTADYLHAEFVRTLANDDAALLGPTYPGPLV